MEDPEMGRMAQYTYQERFKTLKGVFDEFTNRNLFELHSRGVFEELQSPLKVGKESNVFIAKKEKKKLIVKIYNIQNSKFNRMYDYIRKDTRYEYLKKRPRDIIFAWAQREYRNLLLAQKAGASVPKPIAWRWNIVVEEMVGKNGPASPLKDALPVDPARFFVLVMEEVAKLYNAGMVHGDLSSFNILNDNEKPVLIDFSQGTLTKTPNWEELLKRDLANVSRFFGKLGVHSNPEEMFFKVVGKN